MKVVVVWVPSGKTSWIVPEDEPDAVAIVEVPEEPPYVVETV